MGYELDMEDNDFDFMEIIKMTEYDNKDLTYDNITISYDDNEKMELFFEVGEEDEEDLEEEE